MSDLLIAFCQVFLGLLGEVGPEEVSGNGRGGSAALIVVIWIGAFNADGDGDGRIVNGSEANEPGEG